MEKPTYLNPAMRVQVTEETVIFLFTCMWTCTFLVSWLVHSPDFDSLVSTAGNYKEGDTKMTILTNTKVLKIKPILAQPVPGWFKVNRPHC